MTRPACGIQWTGNLAANQTQRWFTFKLAGDMARRLDRDADHRETRSRAGHLESPG